MSTPADPVDLVTRFLRLVEERHLDEAGEFLADGVRIEFPGGRRFDNLHDQVASAAGRYRRIRKVFEHTEALEGPTGTVVYVFGTLEGEAADGTAFSGVRFIDRFVLENGLIADQRVWNDMAESLLSLSPDA